MKDTKYENEMVTIARVKRHIIFLCHSVILTQSLSPLW